MSAAPGQTLERTIRSGDVERCLAFFSAMPEKERRKLAPLASRLFRDRDIDPFNPCRRIAVLATASLTEIKRFRDHVLPHWRSDDFDADCRVLRDRQPAWLRSWCAWLLEREFGRWDFIRRLVRDGICPAPDTDAYVLGAIGGVRNLGQESTVLSGLRSDPAILDELVWRLFEVEPRNQVNLSRMGGMADEMAGWPHALRELAEEGRLDRNRLLTESLAALRRDFSAYHAGWFSRFHEYMQPTVEERAALTEQYLGLLASPNPPTVSFAMRALMDIRKSRRLDSAAFVARAEPVLYAATKTPVMQTMGILAELANEDAALAKRVVELAVVGLEHAQSDVQALALDIIVQHGDPGDDALRAAIVERAPLLAPSLRARATKCFPALERALEEADIDDLEDLRKRAEALPPDLAERSGVAAAAAEVERLSGTLPALYDDGPADRVPSVQIRPSGQMLRSPIRRLFSPLVIFFQLAFPRRKYEFRSSSPSESQLRLKYVMRAIDNPFLSSVPRHIPQSDVTRFAVELLAQLDREEYPYRHLDFDAIFEKPDRLLTGKDVLILANRLSATSWAWAQYPIDDLIGLMEDGRIDSALLGDEMRLLLAIGDIKPNRWAKRLAVVAAETPLHAQVVRSALECALAQEPGTRPRNIHGLLELLFNLCFEAGETVTDDECRAYLDSFAGNSKAAKLARQLLALEPGEPLPHRRAAAIVALRGRLARAEDWAEKQAARRPR